MQLSARHVFLYIPPYQMPVSLAVAEQILGDQGPGRQITCTNFCDSGCSCPVWTLSETRMFLVLPMTFPGGLTGFSGEPSFFQ